MWLKVTAQDDLTGVMTVWQALKMERAATGEAIGRAVDEVRT